MTVTDLDAPEHALCSEALKLASEENSMLRGEIGRLKKCIENGQAAHNEERSARDWLARRKAELTAALETIRDCPPRESSADELLYISAVVEMALRAPDKSEDKEG